MDRGFVNTARGACAAPHGIAVGRLLSPFVAFRSIVAFRSAKGAYSQRYFPAAKGHGTAFAERKATKGDNRAIGWGLRAQDPQTQVDRRRKKVQPERQRQEGPVAVGSGPLPHSCRVDAERNTAPLGSPHRHIVYSIRLKSQYSQGHTPPRNVWKIKPSPPTAEWICCRRLSILSASAPIAAVPGHEGSRADNAPGDPATGPARAQTGATTRPGSAVRRGVGRGERPPPAALGRGRQALIHLVEAAIERHRQARQAASQRREEAGARVGHTPTLRICRSRQTVAQEPVRRLPDRRPPAHRPRPLAAQG